MTAETIAFLSAAAVLAVVCFVAGWNAGSNGRASALDRKMRERELFLHDQFESRRREMAKDEQRRMELMCKTITAKNSYGVGLARERDDEAGKAFELPMESSL